MNRTGNHIPLMVWAAWLVVVLFLRSGPAQLRNQLQLGLQEGFGMVLAGWQSLPFSGTSSRAEDDSADMTARLQAENRQLRQLLAQLRSANEKLQAATGLNPERGSPLLQVSPVSARVVGRLGDPLRGSTELLLALGRQQGLVGQELVLSHAGLLIDQGRDLGLTEDQLTVAGRGLLGRTARVGRWTSLVQPLTDQDFRIGVRVVRRSPLGAVQGPRGILAGTGDACRLEEVPATEAVAVGDDIYTDELISAATGPIYCGRVTRADVAPTATHWTIDVAPLYASQDVPAELQILRTAFHPERMTPN